MKKSIIIVMLFVGMGYFAQAQQAHIYKDSVLLAVRGFEKNTKALDSLQAIYAEEVETSRKTTQGKYANLITPYAPKEGETIDQLKARMSAIDAEKLMLLQEEDKLLETRIKSYNSQLEQQYKLEVKPIVDAVDATIAAYAKKNKLDYVFIMEELSKSLAYVNKGKNITGTIITLVNQELNKK